MASQKHIRIVILTAVLPASVVATLESMGGRRMSVEEVRSGGSIRDVEVLVTDPGVGASADVLMRFPELRLVACYGIGIDAIHISTVKSRGIGICNTPGLLTEDVADLAMALMLASARDIVPQNQYVRDGQWTTIAAKVPLSRSLKNKAIGIVGLGNIGTAIAERASAFRMRVSYHGPRQKPVDYSYMPDLIAMAAESDFLVVASRGGEDTKGIVNRQVLEALGSTGTLVNVSRGSIVDEAALIDVLETGKLGFAALDVFAAEPNVPERLRALPNVIMTPHQGSATVDTRLAMALLLVDNVAAYFFGAPLPTPVLPIAIWAFEL
ncbi:2-hydroxyacid dehydrogenase [Rhizobium sp. XQZ8]|uniref:2-hydroxyacid dehydrogenase n=1 Tax=Rhizobium populisoli TaxID=2859785 RepID=UPI001CA4FB04|nr:2-hydroxyacid dehydrogenase [Rhizobium populisoli]MBW6422501.1 2-hydroxyacid dehydrogenase [Rhizobium populisoli]